jgi:hypothetical protein
MTTENSSRLYIKNPSSESFVLAGSSAQERYIILMNETLQVQNQEYMIKIKEMEDQVEESDISLGKAEMRANNLKGLLKNFHAMDSQLREIGKNQENIIEITRSSVADFKRKAKRHLRYLQFLMVAFSGFYYEFFGITTCFPVIFMLILIAVFQHSTLEAIILPTCEEQETVCKEIKENIKKTIKSQDYIYEFLDEM